MPYIAKAERVFPHPTEAISGVGHLTWALAEILNIYLEGEPESFKRYAEVLGALEALKLELARRFLAPYEELKRGQNGDVFTFQNNREI